MQLKSTGLKNSSVNIWGLQPEMRHPMRIAAKLWKALAEVELVITCGRDGLHSYGSLHYSGYAVDFRTWDKRVNQWDDELRDLVAQQLREELARYSKYYQVIVHSTHIHVEYDKPVD